MSTVAYARILRGRIEEELRSVEDQTLRGVSSPEEYHRLCGQRYELLQVLNMVDETTKKFEDKE